MGCFMAKYGVSTFDEKGKRIKFGSFENLEDAIEWEKQNRVNKSFIIEIGSKTKSAIVWPNGEIYGTLTDDMERFNSCL